MKTKKLLFVMAVLLAVMGSTNAQGQSVEGNFSATPNPVTIKPGGTVTVDLNLSNYSAYTGYEFALVLPEGITLKTAKQNKSAYPLVYDPDEDESVTTHSMQRETQGDGSIKFICISTKTTDPFVAGKMITLTLEASGSATGNLVATMKDIALSTPSGTGQTPQNVDFNIVIQGKPTVTADDKSREYGDANPKLTYTVSEGTIDGLVLTTNATVTSGVGTYTITVPTSDDYDAVNGTLTVTKAPLTISGGTYTITQGETLPTFTAEYSGFKNNEASTVLTTQPTLTLESGVTGASAPGNYTITVTGGEAANYEITRTNGTLTITPRKYTLTYKVDGEVFKTFDYESGATITPEAEPKKEGYTFSGWSEIPKTMPANDVTVTGTFTINKYKLIYKVDGEVYKTVEKEYGASIKPESAPKKEGYTFSGWSQIPKKMPAKDVTVTGTFTINKYKLIYKVDGEEFRSFEIEYGTSITPIAAPTKDGYDFSGWDYVPETMPAHDVIVNATFTLGITDLMMDSGNVKVFDTMGNQIGKPKKGVNIIRTMDGKTKKVLVK